MAQEKAISAAVRTAPPGQKLDWRLGLERLRGAYADGSIRACWVSFRKFELWCEREGRCPLPASSETVERAIDYFFTHCTASTVEGRIHHIRWVHRCMDLPDPTRTESVRLAYRRGERASGGRRRRASSRQATPINGELCARLAEVCSKDLIGLRDRAILSLGYDTLCRAGELVRLQVQDMSELPAGGARILVRRSKADPFAKGEYVYLSDTGLADVRRWLKAGDVLDGPILRPVHFNHYIGLKGFDNGNITTRLRLLARRAGLSDEEMKGLGGHSLRVGAAHDLAVQGRSLAQIMRAGRWRSIESVALYVRDAPINIWAAPPDAEASAEGAREAASLVGEGVGP
jgi:integrase/recombinase XerD